MAKNRPTFYFNNDITKPIRAGGLILYRFNNNSMELLLEESRGIIEDIGGKSDYEDKDIYEMIAREVDEESNNVLDKKDIYLRLVNANNYVYIEKSKYIVFLLEANMKENILDKKDFGNKEFHDNIDRKIKWMKLNVFLLPEIIKYKLNWRIKNKLVFDMLKQIKTNKKRDIILYKNFVKILNFNSKS